MAKINKAQRIELKKSFKADSATGDKFGILTQIQRHCIYFLIFTLLCLSLFSNCTSEHKYQRKFFTFDTIIDITLYSSKNPSAILDSFQRVTVRLDSMLSISNPASDVWKINHRHGSIVPVQPTTASLAKYCKAECDSSRGFFDITVAPLKYLYGLESHQNANHVPSKTELDSVCRFIGCNRMHVLGDTALMLDSGVTIDFGGIAKGYTLTLAKKIFCNAGIQCFLINLGGDMIAWGNKPDGKPWNIGIQHPRDNDELIATISAANTCVFTSGDYERYFIKDGIRYHHLFDAHTGLPARKNQSSTVINADPEAADVNVKVAFFMNAPDGLEYLNHRKLEGVIIDSTGKIWASMGLRNILQLEPTVTVEYR